MTNDQEIPSTYNSKEWEAPLYEKWEKSGLFQPSSDPEKPRYANVLPPPNANGELHLGHASGYTVMDIFGRYERLRGKSVLLLPGKDHAGIQTQVVFEKKLKAECGIDRYELGRDKFYDECYRFSIDRANYMRSQEKSIGLAADWNKEKFTLDPEVSRRALATFVKMYEDGMIYRGERIINWCPRCATALSDIEVVHQETAGKLWYLRYPIKDSADFITVATTRPETLLGDSAVAVHPEDERYRKLVGKAVVLPLLGREISIIADERIDRTFGTGAVKVTPAHDPLDWEIGATHKLPAIQVIDEQALITSAGGPYAGKPVLEARSAVLADLEQAGQLEKEEPHALSLSLCERCKTIIEPLISKQWFVNVNAKRYSLREKTLAALRSDAIAFYPENFRDLMIHWIENLHDWCISRQIWWGHRIPVWYCLACGKERVATGPKSRWFFVRHGETDWNKKKINAGTTDVPLNTTGREQARAAAERLTGEHIDVIFSSPLTRARETAEIIGRVLGVSEIVTDPRLQERDMGEAEGLSYEETRERFPEMRHYDGKPAGNESYHEAEERIWEAVSEHLENHHHKNVLIASHGAVLRALLRRIHGIDPEAIMETKPIENAAPLAVDILDPCEHCGGHFYEQDPDTLDTWFSSGQWPYTTLGYPDGEDARRFYPTDTMIMGRDLLFFWASRMVMMGLYTTGTAPFKHIFFTGLVRDKDGKKMSKSKGNGIDPLEMVEKFGTDALRLSLVAGTTPGQDFRLYEEKIGDYRNFVNKLWNIGRYVATQSTRSDAPLEAKTPADHWILFHLDRVVRETTKHIDSRNLSLAVETLREFTWTLLADWYVEIHKIEKNDALLRHIIDMMLRLWHPFTPFVTEAVHQTLHPTNDTLLMGAKWPIPDQRANAISGAQARGFETLRTFIVHIRTLRALYRIDPVKKLPLTLVGKETMWQEALPLLERMARVCDFTFADASDAPPAGSAQVLTSDAANTLVGFVRLGDIINVAAEKERLGKEITEKKRYADSLAARLADTNFTSRAPETVVAKQQEQLAAVREEITRLKEAAAQLS